ncbi:hypothetical protein [Clostridium intestinale]|uniref:Uncharacterized protein n=1 Tax=Clostridium intestinale TaxID=36845 RepID=A0A7D6VRF0_9CLOT|nr:hypothetical protein [Clostridium intestinale]QLY77810.1 hypothetical protein HZF06_11870 [Clostridium intestinale]
MNSYILIRIRVDALIAIFALLIIPVLYYYIDSIAKEIILRVNGFKLIRKQKILGFKNVQSVYMKNDKFIRTKKVDNISSIKLFKWIKINEG